MGNNILMLYHKAPKQYIQNKKGEYVIYSWYWGMGFFSEMDLLFDDIMIEYYRQDKFVKCKTGIIGWVNLVGSYIYNISFYKIGLNQFYLLGI